MMKNAIKWIYANKTSIGAVLLIICGIPHLDKWLDNEIIDVIYYLGTALGAGGVLHSGIKFQLNRKSRISKDIQASP